MQRLTQKQRQKCSFQLTAASTDYFFLFFIFLTIGPKIGLKMSFARLVELAGRAAQSSSCQRHHRRKQSQVTEDGAEPRLAFKARQTLPVLYLAVLDLLLFRHEREAQRGSKDSGHRQTHSTPPLYNLIISSFPGSKCNQTPPPPPRPLSPPPNKTTVAKNS